jgi:hypothetical protein
MRATFVRTTVLMLLSFCLSGCAAVLVGGLIYKSTKSEEEKAKFTSELQNAAR